ncbi:hypothetical protein BOTBODRAFT_31871 [Botryobasidium botryosum FD-172 SS1]|uniref:PPM-type phosphatase domain-containing protein n=1 Tax=Botryobasidium botryosum (strain FD-172 SS1) TaxID=930990 RepID=A0A067MI26_BOTB1|nr:hypothetical protein BOTBODRAFT_31871 [Botryobasidium botryosum FD-172 SS1]
MDRNAVSSPPRAKADGETNPTFTASPDARSKDITTAGDRNTGVLNQHSSQRGAYTVGIHEDKGSRRTMEDAFSFIVDFAGVKGQGYFAIFDGHAGKHAAEWCGQHFHEELIRQLKAPDNHKKTVPEVLNKTFGAVDDKLGQIAANGLTNSGCTAVTSFLRIEEREEEDDSSSSPSAASGGPKTLTETGEKLAPVGGKEEPSKREKIKAIFKHSPESPTSSPRNSHTVTRRVLYTANVGDARAVLCSAGEAIRLTHDHKGSDKGEVKRIKEAGGFVLNNRVNGVLAVTRSLGDSAMKEFVVGTPYTTTVELTDSDEFLILACDGLWDVLKDQEAVDLVRRETDAQKASEILVKHALDNYSQDNVTVLVVRFHSDAGSA